MAMSGKAEPYRTAGGKAAKSAHAFASDGERQQSGLHGTKNCLKKDNRLRGGCCWSWFRLLQRHHAQAVRQCATEF